MCIKPGAIQYTDSAGPRPGRGEGGPAWRNPLADQVFDVINHTARWYQKRDRFLCQSQVLLDCAVYHRAGGSFAMSMAGKIAALASIYLD